jgi:competence protein ComEA
MDNMPVIALSRRQVALVALALLFVLAVAGKRLAASGSAEGTSPSAPAAIAPLAASSPARPRLVVHVVGAVRRPGLYRLRDGARVADAVSRAGGAVHAADLSALNLAAPLADGAQVLVPRRQPGGPNAAASVGTGAGPPLSLATATVDQLDELPGVGPVTAQKIVDYRTANGPFGSVEELDEIPGIGPARIEQIRDLVTP